VARAVVWRIARRPYALDRLGIGARQDGGRWNYPGTAVIYAGRTIAIAALERFVHVAGIVPRDLVLIRVELPGDHPAEQPEPAGLPEGWDLVPAGPASMEFGTRWARESRSLVLYLPSALVREEQIAVLNPNHPEFHAVTMRIVRDFHYDPRMYLPRRVAATTD
jgi:RES domain-containing protein